MSAETSVPEPEADEFVLCCRFARGWPWRKVVSFFFFLFVGFCFFLFYRTMFGRESLLDGTAAGKGGEETTTMRKQAFQTP